jgi:hypothetical protein
MTRSAHTTDIRIVHTDCSPQRAKEIAIATLHEYVGASEGGFLGTTLALYGNDALTVADELKEHGYAVRVTRGPGA